MSVTNDLFSINEISPAAFAKSGMNGLNYALSLIKRKEGDDLLFLTSPCFAPALPYRKTGVESIQQIVFTDFLVELFHKQAFSFIGMFLRRSPGILQFSSSFPAKIKELMLRRQTEDEMEWFFQLMRTMKALATGAEALALKETPPLLPGLSQAAVKINKMKNYVKENFRRRIGRDEAASLVGLSPNGFSRFFKQHTGLVFVKYVEQVRLEEALKLLLTTDDTVAGIAYSCGFTSPHYFNNLFKHYYGVSPGRFGRVVSYEL